MSIAARGATLALLVAAVACGAFASSASALTQVTCSGTNSFAYSPSITNTAQNVAVTQSTTFSPCTSLTNPSITSGSISLSYTGPASCTSLLQTDSGALPITWNTGQTSTFSFNSTSSLVNGEIVAVLTGTITAGLFNGATVVQQVTLAADLTACSGAGIASSSGPTVLTIVGL